MKFREMQFRVNGKTRHFMFETKHYERYYLPTDVERCLIHLAERRTENLRRKRNGTDWSDSQ